MSEIGSQIFSSLALGARIGITGPAGAGKTTLANHMREMGANVESEGARKWLRKNGIEHFWDMRPPQIARMHLDLLNAYEQSVAQVFDRIAVDALFHVRPAADEIDLRAFESRAAAFCRSLSVIIYMPYRSEYLVDDGVRKLDDKFQLEMGSYIFLKLLEYGLLGRTVIYRHHLDVDSNIAAVEEALRGQA
jgi:predicted ATPase